MSYRLELSPCALNDLIGPRGLPPWFMDVPCYTGVMIHEGNTVKNTMGCILVGMNTVKGCVMESKKYLAIIMKKICEAEERGENVQLTIYN